MSSEMISMREDAEKIIRDTIEDVMPDRAVKKSLNDLKLEGDIYIIAIGKAAWAMSSAAVEVLGTDFKKGILVTKYGHVKKKIEGFQIIEAGHPTPDENSVLGAQMVLEMLREIPQIGTVLFLLSGGGSSLVELPERGLSLGDIQKVTRQLLFSGADITEINVIRKKLSAIKGGKLAGYLNGRKAYAIILSDIVSGDPDMIASGITYPDRTSTEDVERIMNKYQLKFDPKTVEVLRRSCLYTKAEVTNLVVGSVGQLCQAAARHAKEQGYNVHLITTSLSGEAKEAGKWIAGMAENDYPRPFAVIAGGETIVKVTGNGLGGRNQEIALSAAAELAGKKGVLLFSIGSDGTDGPTDAAGGIVDGETAGKLEASGMRISEILKKNDSYYALKKVEGLVFTGATGTNVNDVTVLLCR